MREQVSDCQGLGLGEGWTMKGQPEGMWEVMEHVCILIVLVVTMCWWWSTFVLKLTELARRGGSRL